MSLWIISRTTPKISQTVNLCKDLFTFALLYCNQEGKKSLALRINQNNKEVY